MLTGKRLAAALGAASGSMMLGSLIATHTVSAINPFYRFAAPAGWREPAYAPPEPTRPAPPTFTPIGWGPDVIAEPPRAEPPPAPEPDAFDDSELLAELEGPLPPFEAEPTPMPAVMRIESPRTTVLSEPEPAEQPVAIVAPPTDY
ncbi:hypothetical protein CKY28_08525 [Sphingomonas lenta]|uniref:Uncharacterized protein n=2 Tax=Sphingomonas lenta TaxID=1141887 RepID=A0A2A2SEK6_9SPHN|nr:hypothetical protein CKY28_08525 [Sphingomonas lenta]